MRKYFTVYKNALSSALQYRLNVGLTVVSHVVTLSGLVFLWFAIYRSGQAVGNYTLEAILMYYLVLTILRLVIANGVGMGFEISEEMRDGVIANYLLKPFSYTFERLMKAFGESTIIAFLIFPVVVVMIALWGHLVELPNFVGWLQFLGMAFIGLIFYFLIYYLSALSSFWMTDGRSTIFAVLVVSGLFNGSMLPLDLFPDWFLAINTYSPFQYLMFLPIQTFLGRVTDWSTVLLIGAAWMMIFSFLIWFVWRSGVKRFESVGR